MSVIIRPSEEETWACDPRWTQLREDFGRTLLGDLAFSLNRASVAWDNGDERPARIGPPGSALLTLNPRNPAYRWAAGECLRQGVLWSPVGARAGAVQLPNGVSEPERILRLVHRATSAQLDVVPSDSAVLETSGAWDFLFPTWSPQYLMARSSALRIGQALWMFRDAPRRRKERDASFPLEPLQRSYETALGMSVEDFVGLVLLLYGASVSERPVLTPTLYVDAATAERFGVISQPADGLLFRSHVATMLRLLGASRQEMLAWMADSIEGESATPPSELDLLRAPNPLHRFPLLRPLTDDPDRYIAPVPSTLLEWLYEPMVNHLYGSLSADRTLRKPFALAFEEYVGLVLDAYRASGPPWLHEDQLRPRSGGAVVDWARPFGNSLVMVDAKRCFIEPLARYRLHPSDWETLETGLRRGVEQAAEFMRSVSDGKVAPLGAGTGRQPIVILVSQGDTAVIGMQKRIEKDLAELGAAKLPGMKVILLSLDQLQHVATNWQERGDGWLEQLLLRIADEGRSIIAKEAPHRATGPLWHEVQRLFPPRAAELES